MTIFIDSPTPSSLTNYDGLLSAIQTWLNRTDLQDKVPDFVRLAEARFRRVLVMPDMETEVAFTPSASAALPVDFDSVRSVSITSPVQAILAPVAPAEFYTLPTSAPGMPEVTGVPGKFYINAGTIKTWPAPDDTYTGVLSYRANLPALGVGNETNWLLTKHPDAYLFAALVQAEFYGWNDERLPLIKSALDEILGEITMAGNRVRYGGGPVVMKPAVCEGLRTTPYRL